MVLSYVIWAILLSPPSQQAKTIREVRGPQIIDASMVIPATLFSESGIIMICNNFLAANRVAGMVRLLISTDAQDMLSMGGGGVTDVSFAEWLELYANAKQNLPAAAELVSVRGNAAVRIRSADGKVSERVLSGRTPFIISFHDELVLIRGLGLTHVWNPDAASFATFEVFVQSPRPWNLSEAQEFSRSYRAKTNIADLVIQISNGWYFPGESNYPVANRFLPRLSPPTLEEFKRLHRFYCNDATGGCRQSGGRPR